MNYDDILVELGDFGRWQKYVAFMCALGAIEGGIITMTYTFTGYEPSAFVCDLPKCGNDTDYMSLVKNSSLFGYNEEDGKTDYCLIRPLKAEIPTGEPCTLDSFDFTKKQQEYCTDYKNVHYDHFAMDKTVATDFGLICKDQFMVALVGSIYMSGLFFGAGIFGTLSDAIGRRPGSMIAIAFGAIFQLIGAFMPEYYSYTATRFLAAMGSLGCFMVPFSLAVECVGQKWVTPVGVLYQIPFAIGEIILGLTVMGVRTWKMVHIVLGAPLLLLCAMFFVLPESPRWLIAKKRYAEARRTLERAATFNRVTIPEHLLQAPNDSETSSQKKEESQQIQKDAATKQKELGIATLFTHPELRKYTLVMFVNWIVVTLGYYGISMSSANLSGDPYVSFILSAVVEIPAYIIAPIIMDIWGRKPYVAFSMILAGAACIPAGFTTGGAQTALVLIGKFGAAGAFGILYLYTVELYPTEIRSTGLGFCSMMARIGGIAAPQVAIFLPSVTFKELPLIIMGASTLFGGIISLIFLPETLGVPLVNTLKDVEHLKENDKTIFSCISRKELARRLEANRQETSKVVA